ncbi:MAG: NADH-quinone oxidoreductase subunit L [Myxococcota bacterium]
METAQYFPLALIPLLPLLGAAVLAVLGAQLPRTVVNGIALTSVLGAFGITVVSTLTLVEVGHPLKVVLGSWMSVGRFDVDLALALDPLNAALLLVVTGVGFLIHVYSTEYMGHDPGHWRYFAYLNLFIFAMSVLVLGASLPVMFIGWEGVGLASYLLIGFWFTDLQKARAGKKAFIVNRVGDFGFLLGTFILFGVFGTGDFYELRTLTEGLPETAVIRSLGLFPGMSVQTAATFACLCLFLGACGKSAQIPLYVWLPDAMAGPTPVSALIHAATMVTAGVYMCCRLYFLFDLAPAAAETVAVVGGLTAFFAATIGLAQDDIKKVLAYSTVSQLGYMFLAVGLGGYAAAMFHVVTHAFFKACLFLGAGAVIHALHEEQDIQRMGGLRKRLPVVYWTFVVSTLALAGIPVFSGFFSKDAILAYAWQDDRMLWGLGYLAAGLTALYMTRLVCLTFYGEYRNLDDKGQPIAVHAPHWPMTLPLIVLALMAAGAGFLNMPHVISHDYALLFEHALAPAVASKELHLDAKTEWTLMGASVGIAVLGMLIGFVIYRKGPSRWMQRLTAGGIGRFAYTMLYEKWFIDEVYQRLIVRPLQMLSALMATVMDMWIIDGLIVRGSGYTVVAIGRLFSRLQTGSVQIYATVLVVGVAIILMWAV